MKGTRRRNMSSRGAEKSQRFEGGSELDGAIFTFIFRVLLRESPRIREHWQKLRLNPSVSIVI